MVHATFVIDQQDAYRLLRMYKRMQPLKFTHCNQCWIHESAAQYTEMRASQGVCCFKAALDVGVQNLSLCSIGYQVNDV